MHQLIELAIGVYAFRRILLLIGVLYDEIGLGTIRIQCIFSLLSDIPTDFTVRTFPILWVKQLRRFGCEDSVWPVRTGMIDGFRCGTCKLLCPLSCVILSVVLAEGCHHLLNFASVVPVSVTNFTSYQQNGVSSSIWSETGAMKDAYAGYRQTPSPLHNMHLHRPRALVKRGIKRGRDIFQVVAVFYGVAVGVVAGG